MRLLDLFCGAGGASVGYYRAGFDVVGVDVAPQPFYPFEFIRCDALSLDYEFLMAFDAVHASPPCQQYSVAAALARRRGKQYPDLVHPVRAMLIASGLPYVIENVQGAPVYGIGLCGSMFGLGVRRHRIFESNVAIPLPARGCSCRGGSWVTVAGSSYAKNEGALAMGIDWPIDKAQLTEAIPPAYTQYIGEKLLISVSESRCNSVSESQRVSVSEGRADYVSEQPVLTVSEFRANSVLYERRLVPVTRRCAACGAPLSQGTARRKFCNDACRLRAFRGRSVDERRYRR